MFSNPANSAGTKRSLQRPHPPPPALDLARARPRETSLASGGAPKIRVGDVGLPDHDDDEGELLQLSSSGSSESESESPSPPLLTHGDRSTQGKNSSKTTLAPLRSSSRTSSRSSSRTRSADNTDDALPEDISKDLAALQQLRRSVKTNLRLRPIRSRSNLPKMNLDLDLDGVIPPAPFPLSVRDGEAISTKGSSIYPINTTVINTQNAPPLSASSPASSAYYTPTAETPHTAFFTARLPRTTLIDQATLPILSLQPPNNLNPITPGELADRLQATRRPLLIDTRPSAFYNQVRLKESINVVLPTPKRRRIQNLDELRECMPEEGRARLDALTGESNVWDGSFVLIGDGNSDDVHAPLIAVLQIPEAPMAYLSGSLYSPLLEPFINVETTGTPQHATLFVIKNRNTPLSSPLPPLPGNIASPISAPALYSRLTAPSRPLLIDTRPLAAHQAFHLRDSVSIAIPSLILKRCRKPGGGLPSLSALKQFATTEQGKAQWDTLMAPDGGWDGNVVIYDDEMDVKDRDSPGATGWAIMPIILPLLKTDGRIEYLEGGLARAGHDPELGTLIVTAEEVDTEANRTSTPMSGGFAKKNGGGLFRLDTDAAGKFKKLPEIDFNPSPASNPPSPLPAHTPPAQAQGPPPSPLPIMPSTTRISPSLSHSANIVDASPSPPPSSIGFRRPLPPRRPSVPALRRLDTRSAERLTAGPPKLSVLTKPMRSATLAVPPMLTLNIGSLNGPPQSPSHLNLMYSTHSPPLSARFMSPTNDPNNYLTPYYTPPHTPSTPRVGFGFLDDPPPTARPDMDPPTTEEPFPVFTVSTILPNFLYLGPELTTPEHVKELQDLGVKRVLNLAAECDDDMGLGLKESFRYYKIPMRDTVEEDGIARGVREACDFIDDARLHSAPTYVHCKAGKSRSVTAVMAYLIHANHWTLSRAYAFVLERRKGISPNIGFVSELMSFEEQELGGKSVGVQPTSAIGSAVATGASNGGNGEGGGMQHAQATAQEAYAQSGVHRRGAHVRESLPPALSLTHTTSSAMYASEGVNGPMSAASVMDKESAGALGSGMSTVISPLSMRDRVLGDAGQEMEIRDASGRYRHARRAPVDETTLQPMRRVSKAGLEGGWA